MRCINLTLVDGPVCLNFLVIILLDSPTSFCGSTPVAANRLACTGIDSGNLLIGLRVDGDLKSLWITSKSTCAHRSRF